MVLSRSFTYKPFFWLALIIVGVGGCYISYKFFPKAFPIVHIDISMDRAQALTKARELAAEHNWGPDDFSQAVSFDTDEETKNFIELEGGGYQALTKILQEKDYTPYTWHVRHYHQYEPLETNIFFTPDGRPYGFTQKIPEIQKGAALSESQARQLALTEAQTAWHINVADFKEVEASHDIKPNGRIDYSFVFEQTTKKVAEAPYRLKLVVSGDKLTELTYSIKVPEAFERRYAQMRSANTSIAFTASFFMALLYLIFGCLYGLIYLHRHHRFVWKPAFVAAFILATLQILNTINQLPLTWMHYDTALSQTTFLLEILLPLLIQWIALTCSLTLIISVAEGLTRTAFGDHPQFWKLWSKDNASSYEIFGRTIGGYLIIGFDLSFIVVLYYFASRYLGWWSPSETLFNPNILATYFPWLSPLAQSLNAGFMEECLFRAIPLAGAYLIGRYYKHPHLFLGLGFIVQAVIFGAAHANYPAQPAYARLVELLIPSCVFGYIYVRFGLLPAIISHTVFDIFWFSLPIFISTSAGIITQQLLIIVGALIPLLIIIINYFQKRSLRELPTDAYNSSWKSAPKSHKVEEKQTYTSMASFMHKNITYYAGAAGILGLILWFITTPFKQDNLPLKLSSTQVAELSRQFLHQKSIDLTDAWKPMRIASAELNEQHRFIWKTMGKNSYNSLLGTYLMPATWNVRYAQFSGDVAERAEEYITFFDGTGTLMRFYHQLPEAQEGAMLTQDQARTQAYDVLKNVYTLSPDAVHEITALSEKKPARLDWTFTFSTNEHTLNAGGETRVTITISGNTVTDYFRSIFVPEEWLRKDRQEQTYLTLLRFICVFFAMVGGIVLILFMLRRWRILQFSLSFFFTLFTLLLIKSCLQILNLWPIFTYIFQTSEPYSHQVWKLLGQLALQILLTTTIIAGQATIFSSIVPVIHVRLNALYRCFVGVSVGCALAGFASLLFFLLPQAVPLWADYSQAAAYFPVVSIIATVFTSFVSITALELLIFFVIDRLTYSWSRNRLYACIIIVFWYALLTGFSSMNSFTQWIITFVCGSITAIIVYKYITRMERATIPFIIASVMILRLIQQIIFYPFPGALVGSVLAIGIVSLSAWWWSQMLCSFADAKLEKHK